MANNTDKIALAAIVIGVFAFVMALPALIIAGLDSKTVDVSNTQNISAVPNQTDVSGNMNVSGNFTVNQITPSSSITTGSIVTKGGIGVQGAIFAGQGLYATVLDAIGALTIGTTYQTGITMGRTGLPITLVANQVTATADMSTQHVFPAADSTYDLGNANREYRNVYIGGNIYNVTNFPIKPSGGIYSMTADGPIFSTPTLSPITLLGTTGVTSLPLPFTIPGGSMVTGDTWSLKVGGAFTLSAATQVIIGLYVDNLLTTQSVLSVTGSPPSPASGFFTFQAGFTVRNSGVNGVVLGQSSASWNSFQDQDITQSAPIDTTTDMLWDVRFSTNSPGTGLVSFQARFVNMQKVY